MKEKIRDEINHFVAAYQHHKNLSTSWLEPLVAFAAAADPLFAELKNVVVDSHALPKDLLPDGQTVISFFLPFPKSIAASNIKRDLSSPEWAVTYIETNELINRLAEHMQVYLEKFGEKAVAVPATHNWIEDKLVSNWSHRHVAYVAGLGKFGLNNMLITAKGCSGRLGSLVTTAMIEPDSRPQQEACLYKFDGTCKQCVRRCVNDALSANGFDRFRCYAKLLENVEEHKNLGYADVCGKCLAATPCTHTNPVVHKLRQEKDRGVRCDT
jgi:epoxyqueuosine reductase QueG